MARAIDGDALKQWCEKIIDQACHPATVQIGEVFLDKVRSMPTLTPPNEWVSVEERLPSDEHPVLVFVGYADTMTGFITTSSYFCFDENPHWQWDGLVRDEQRTLFWMPLPAPPGKNNNVPTKAPNEPLTLEQLRKMDGDPVWVEDVKHWALIDIEKGGQWDGVPFAIWAENGMKFTYNIKNRGLHCYRRPPEGEEAGNG